MHVDPAFNSTKIMKKTATFICFAFMLTGSVFAQSCPKQKASKGLYKGDLLYASTPSYIQGVVKLPQMAAYTAEDAAICVALNAFSLTSQQRNVENGVLSSVLDQEWDGSMWVDDLLESFTYNADGSLASALTQTHDGTTWTNKSLTSSVYDAANRLTGFVIQEWDGAAMDWANARRMTWTLDGAGNRIGTLQEEWHGTDWEPTFRSGNTYGSNGLLTAFQTEDFDNGAWAIVSLREIEYDDQDRISQGLNWFHDMTSGMLEIVGRDIYTYPDELTAVVTGQIPVDDDSGAEAWTDFFRFTNVFNGDGNLVSSSRESNFGVWMPTGKTSYEYNTEGLENALIDQNWDGTRYTNNYAYFTTYDDNGDVATLLYQEESGTGKANSMAWTNVSLSTFAYQEVVTSLREEQPLNATSMDVYPNPARGTIRMNISLQAQEIIQVDVYDILGRHISNLTKEQAAQGVHQVQWTPEALPAGLYFVRLQTGSEILTQTVTIIQ